MYKNSKMKKKKKKKKKKKNRNKSKNAHRQCVQACKYRICSGGVASAVVDAATSEVSKRLQIIDGLLGG